MFDELFTGWERSRWKTGVGGWAVEKGVGTPRERAPGPELFMFDGTCSSVGKKAGDLVK